MSAAALHPTHCGEELQLQREEGKLQRELQVLESLKMRVANL